MLTDHSLRKADFLTGLALLLFGAATLVAVWFFPWDLPTIRQSGWYSAPGLIPGAVALVLMGQGLRLTLYAARNGGRWRRADGRRALNRIRTPEMRRAGLVALLLVVYVYGLVGRVPFIPASFVFLVAFMFLFRATAWWKILLISALSAAAIGFGFEYLAQVPLP